MHRDRDMGNGLSESGNSALKLATGVRKPPTGFPLHTSIGRLMRHMRNTLYSPWVAAQRRQRSEKFTERYSDMFVCVFSFAHALKPAGDFENCCCFRNEREGK